jgi:cold shock CspA family protein
VRDDGWEDVLVRGDAIRRAGFVTLSPGTRWGSIPVPSPSGGGVEADKLRLI